jgi:DNA-binding LacI/PurR family transcriptional regulator
MANIKDVAKAAGVSTSTVSRTINNSSSIPAETKARITEIMKQLNYTPNQNAKSLTTNKSYTITLIVDVDDEKSFQNPFFYEIMHGIEKYVYNKEYSFIVANLKTMMKKQSVLDWLIRSKRTEGVILPSSMLDSKTVESLRKDKIPFVSIGEPIHLKDSITWVDIDNKRGAEVAVYSLLESGYKNIAYLGYDNTKLFNQRRYEGYLNVLESEKIEIIPSYIIECNNNKDNGYNHTKTLLNLNNRPDAILCADGELSFGAIKAIQENGLSIPSDFGLISYDETKIAELSYPSISTVNVDMFEMGTQCAKLLFDQIENHQSINQGVLISASLNKRETTK